MSDGTTERTAMKQAAERYMSQCRRDGDCLVRDVKRYGGIKLAGQRWSAHRLIYTVMHGAIPDGLVVRHTCDRTQCVEPRHLVAGTQAQNVRDIFDRDRRHAPWRHGEDHRDAVLTEDLVGSLRQSAARGVSISALAREHGLTYGSVHSAVRGITWAHLTEPAPVPKRRRPYPPSSRRLSATRADDCVRAAGMAANGWSLAEIAAALGVSRTTAFKMTRGAQEVAS